MDKDKNMAATAMDALRERVAHLESRIEMLAGDPPFIRDIIVRLAKLEQRDAAPPPNEP